MTETLDVPVSALRSSAPVAEIESLTYHYPGSVRPALAAVDLSIDPGLTVVAGGSGSGKSSLLRVLNGLVPHFHGGRIAGRANVGGMQVVTSRTARLARRVGFVFQDPESQFVYGVVEREVAFGPENIGVARHKIGDRVEESLAAVGIGHLRHRSIATLSGGEKQRVALASALAMRPMVLALDEPTSQLDPAGAAALLDACVRLRDGGITLVVAEHRLGRLLQEADRMVVMDQGQAVAGTVRQLADALEHPPQLLELARRLELGAAPLTLAEARLVAPSLRRPAADPAPARGDVVWETRGLGLRAGLETLLEGADLNGRAGEVVVLMGENGSGKTTLLRAIAGLQRPAAGTVARDLAPGRRTAYLPQDPTTILHRASVRAEVDLTLSRAPSGGKAEAILAELGLTHLAGAYPRDLSGGERQRAALAAILAGPPALALLDEPTRGMDGAARRAIAAIVRRMREAGSSVVMATHDSELAAELGDRIIRLADRRATDLGPPNRALAAGMPGATQIAELYPGGPVTVDGVLRCL